MQIHIRPMLSSISGPTVWFLVSQLAGTPRRLSPHTGCSPLKKRQKSLIEEGFFFFSWSANIGSVAKEGRKMRQRSPERLPAFTTMQRPHCKCSNTAGITVCVWHPPPPHQTAYTYVKNITTSLHWGIGGLRLPGRNTAMPCRPTADESFLLVS